jgi:hypothetical protein
VKRAWVVLAGVVSALVVMMAPVNLGPRAHAAYLLAILVLAVVICAAVTYWIWTIAELLRVGPGAEREWWLAALAVVVVLGPLGALAYQLAAPSFSSDTDRSLHH